MSREESSIIVIDPVSPSSIPQVAPSSGLIPLIHALNPLGAIGKTIVELAAYRVEAKRLQTEQKRIQAQARAFDVAINARVKEEMAHLELRRYAIAKGFDYAEKVLRERRTTRDAVIRALRQATDSMTKMISQKPFPPEAAFETQREVISILSNTLVELDRHGVQQAQMLSAGLANFIDDARRQLPPPSNILQGNQR